MNTLLILAESLIVAYLMRRLAHRFRLPAVTGYVAAGIFLGGSYLVPLPGGSHIIQHFMLSPPKLDALQVVTQIALGVVAVAIGADLQLPRLRRIGKSIILIVLFESLGACLLVTAAISLLWPHRIATAIVLGAVACATAPAATLAVIHEYRARGTLTSTILAVVGLDDAVALMIFSFCSTVAKSMLTHSAVAVPQVLARPLLEILMSLILGGVVGAAAAYFIGKERDREMILMLAATAVLLTSGLALQYKLSQLLACMAAGFTIVNLNPFVRNRLHEAIRALGPIFYALFFVIGGAHLDLTLISVVGGISLVYFIARSSGKYFGAWLGATLGKAPTKIRRFIGMSLLPQVGVAVALALVVAHEFGKGACGPEGVRLASTVVNVLLFTTIITEIVGPLLTRRSLMLAGECHSATATLDNKLQS